MVILDLLLDRFDSRQYFMRAKWWFFVVSINNVETLVFLRLVKEILPLTSKRVVTSKIQLNLNRWTGLQYFAILRAFLHVNKYLTFKTVLFPVVLWHICNFGSLKPIIRKIRLSKRICLSIRSDNRRFILPRNLNLARIIVSSMNEKFP